MAIGGNAALDDDDRAVRRALQFPGDAQPADARVPHRQRGVQNAAFGRERMRDGCVGAGRGREGKGGAETHHGAPVVGGSRRNPAVRKHDVAAGARSRAIGATHLPVGAVRLPQDLAPSGSMATGCPGFKGPAPPPVLMGFARHSTRQSAYVNRFMPMER